MHWFPTLYPTVRSWQSCVHPLTLRLRHSFMLQFFSSDWSPQSSFPSQIFPSEMQRPLEHIKKEPLHKLPEKGKMLLLAQFLKRVREHFWVELDRFIVLSWGLLVATPFVSAICPFHYPEEAVLTVTLMNSFQLWAKKSILTCRQTFEV